MDKRRVSQIKAQFDLVVQNDPEAHIEFWYARDLMPLLGYDRWENFDKVIARAMESCESSGTLVSDHFREVTKIDNRRKGRSAFCQRLPVDALRMLFDRAERRSQKGRDRFCAKLFRRPDAEARGH